MGASSTSAATSAPGNNNNNSNNLALAAAAQFLQQAQQQSLSAAGTQSTSGAPGPSAAAQAAADTFQTLASLMNSSVAVAAAANKHLLPNSTPVSSLLPQIPGLGSTSSAPSSASQQHLQQNAITSQLAALLSGVGSTLKQPPTSHYPQPISAASNPLLRHSMGADVAVAAGVPGAMGMPNMQSWSLDQLQQHIQVLEQIKQPVPQTVSLLLADAKRKEDKRNAKRIANRRSASTSRARKKAYVQEMTELNARLKRQALILSLLPDMVIVIGVDGNITFCSAQVERVLRYNMKEIEGMNLADLLIPASRDKLNRLIKQLLGMKGDQRKAGANSQEDMKGPLVGNNANEASDQGDSNATGEAISSGAENSATDGGAAAVSEATFPLSVVQVEAKRQKSTQKQEHASTDNSDNSTYPSKNLSSFTVSNSSQRSASAVFLDAAKEVATAKETSAGSKNPSSDISNSSSLSTNAQNVLKANTNLERNVRIHNKKIKAELESGYRDDVTGADVTANNATARLSSLQHRLEASSSEDDSGYRESNDSREETSSSVSESSGSNGRRKPIAPTCNICLIRKDLTTIWCEVTSSIRTKEPEEDACGGDSVSGMETNKKSKFPESSASSVVARSSEPDQQQPREDKGDQEVQKELLLCLRPVRDGDQKMQKKITFDERTKKLDSKKRLASEAGWTTGQTTSSGKGSSSRPFKKRGLAEVSNSTLSKDNLDVAEMDTDAAESLMLMNKKP
ncbi:hypothetical protein ACA910_005581 [Epithemia clementina (nom. ined.)]